MGDEAELELLLSFDGASLCGSTTPMLPIAQAGDSYKRRRLTTTGTEMNVILADHTNLPRPRSSSTISSQLLDDFWSEVRRVMSEKGIPNDL
jgi:hypothetical protein